MFNLTPTVRNLLIANAVFFLAQTSFLPLLTQVGSLYPIGSPYFYPWQFFTYMFLHDPGSWMHLLSNMFGLISFGPLLEQRWGPSRFLTFWLICGVGAGLLYEGVRGYEMHKMEQARQEFHQSPSGPEFADFFRSYGSNYTGYETLAAALQRNPNNEDILRSSTQAVDALAHDITTSRHGGMLGASGALFGLLFAFAYLFPNTELMLLFFPFPIKAKYFVFLYAAYELYAGVHRTPGDNVAHFAHLGGLLIGFIVLKFWEGGRERFY
ncbi:MAG: hypothetical protein JWR44_3498 [Hymenobacter sp.]|jgi:membrane associated rhomboid family serine protease|nr:hypothetical protein [Hymenobacter sp.]